MEHVGRGAGPLVQSHDIQSDGFGDVLDYSCRTTNYLLRSRLKGYADAFRLARDGRFAEGVSLGALQQARYVTRRHSKMMAANPDWAPQISGGFALLPKNHHFIKRTETGSYLCAPLGSSRSGIAPLHVRLPDSISECVERAEVGEVLLTCNRIYLAGLTAKAGGLRVRCVSSQTRRPR